MTTVWKKWMTAAVLAMGCMFGAYIMAVSAPNNDTVLQAFHIITMILFFCGIVGCGGYFLIEYFED